MIALMLMPALLAADAPPPPPKAKPAGDPVVAQAVAKFRENFDRFGTLEVQWRREQHYTEAWIAMQDRLAEEQAKAVEAMDPSDPRFDQAQKASQAKRGAMTQFRVPTAFHQTFLTDRIRFQMRTARQPGIVLDPDAKLDMPSDGPTTAANLPQDFVGVSFISYRGIPSEGFRTWRIDYPGNPGYGSILTRNQNTGEAFFPPLGINRRDWAGDDSQWHPIDLFLRDPTAEIRAVGREKVGDRETVVLERWGGPEPNKPGMTTGGPVIRAFLDMERGALPLKIEWTMGQKAMGQPPTTSPGVRPHQVLETTEIVQVKGAGFYPKRGTIRTFGSDPGSWKGTGPPPVDLMEETTWRAVAIEANAPLKDDMSLPFPQGVYYFDQRIGASLYEGAIVAGGTRLPWLLCLGLLAGWAIFGVVMMARSMIRKSRKRSLRMARG